MIDQTERARRHYIVDEAIHSQVMEDNEPGRDHIRNLYLWADGQMSLDEVMAQLDRKYHV